MSAQSPLNSSTQNTIMGLAPLMKLAFSGDDLKPIGEKLLERSKQHPDDANALMDLATILLLIGQRDIALATQIEALQHQQVFHIPSVGEPKLRVLALMSPGDLMANTPIEFLLEDSNIALDIMYIGVGIPAVEQLPEHDVMFVAIGESDETHFVLEELSNLTELWPRPVVNTPDHILELARDTSAKLLQDIPGVEMPLSVRVNREDLQKLGNEELTLQSLLEGHDYPIIVRPVGSHAGQGLKRINSADEIADYLNAVPKADFYLAPFVDYHSPDNLFRKYRIILIEGKPFVCHMAVSSHWIIHYLNAGMTESAEKRAEEEKFMLNFENNFVPRHREALKEIAKRIGLDYIGIDCSETSDGKLLIFEVDSDMIVHNLDPVDVFPYKTPQMEKLFFAFRNMLTKAASH